VRAEGVHDRLVPDRLRMAYEALRGHVVGAGPGAAVPGPGLALLLRRGMSAWIESCASWLSRSAAAPACSLALAAPPREVQRAEVVRVLATRLRPRVARGCP
jgi:hypothetical protein